MTLLRAAIVGLAALILTGTAWAQTPAGTWQGNIDLEPPLAIGVTFAEGKDGLTGTIDIPAQGVTELSLTEVTLSGDTVSFGREGVPGTPRVNGVVAGTGETAQITGDFTQSAHSFSSTLTRGASGAARPQEPKPPFLHRSETVQLQSGEVTLAGTLTLRWLQARFYLGLAR